MEGNLITLLLVLGSNFVLTEAGGLGTSCSDYGVQDLTTCDVADSYCGPQGKCICIEGFSANGVKCETYFNCINEGCRYGSCNYTTRACQCPESRARFDCDDIVDQDHPLSSKIDLTTAGCESCNKTGTFSCLPEIGKCTCKYGYIGEFCSEGRVKVEVCKADSMIVSLDLYSKSIDSHSFDGLMYIYGKKYDDGCTINRDPSSFIYTTPNLILNECATIERDVSPNGDVGYVVDIVVQYKKEYVTVHDIIHRLSCIQLASGVFEISHVTSADPVRDFSLGGNSLNTVSAIVMEIEGTRMEFEEYPDTFQLGVNLSITFTLQNTNVFQAFMVTELTTTGIGEGEQADVSKNLLKDRCPEADAYDVLQPNPIDVSDYDVNDLTNKNIIRIRIYAHKFVVGDRVTVSGRAQACANKADCTFPISCAALKRRKRSTLENAVELKLEKTITVIDRDTGNNGKGRFGGSGVGGNVMTNQCRSSLEYIATFTILASLLFLTYFVLIIFCLCARRRRREAESEAAAEKLDYHQNEMTPGMHHVQKRQYSMSNPSYE